MNLLRTRNTLIALVIALACGPALAQTPDGQGPGALVFSPAQPQPGSVVAVVYAPSPSWPSGDAVVLRARVRTPGDRAYGVGAETGDLARLSRGEDGLFRGSFEFPGEAVFLLAAVSTPGGERVDTNLRQGWSLLAHDAEGRPLYDAIAQQLQDLTGRDYRSGLRVARLIAELYPDRPQSWEQLRFFQDNASGSEADSAVVAERAQRIERFERALSSQEHPDPDDLSGMFFLAGPFSEVGRRWGERLVAQAPTHRTAVEIRTIRAFRAYSERPDSLLRALDTLWDEVGPATRVLLDGGFQAAMGTGDPQAIRRWADRGVAARPWTSAGVARVLAINEGTRALGIERLRVEIERARDEPLQTRSLFASVTDHETSRAQRAAWLQAALGSALLAAGERDAALAALNEAASVRWDPDLFSALAEARLASDDSLGAARALARIAVDTGANARDVARERGPLLVGARDWQRLVADAGRTLQERTLQASMSARLPEGVTVLDSDGASVELASLVRGAPTVLVLYSQSCGYCVEATPGIEALSAQLAEDGARLILLSTGLPGAESEAFFAEYGFSGPVYYDVDREAALALGSAGVPAYFVLDGGGAVRFRFSSLGAIPRQIEALLASEPASP